MTDMTAGASGRQTRPDLDQGLNLISVILFGGVLAAGLLFTAYSLYVDISEAGTSVRTYLPFLLLGVALLIALGFEFVNGFHDTANAVATVIYTNSLAPVFAVIVTFVRVAGSIASSVNRFVCQASISSVMPLKVLPSMTKPSPSRAPRWMLDSFPVRRPEPHSTASTTRSSVCTGLILTQPAPRRPA